MDYFGSQGNVLGSTHVVEQLLFSMFHLIVTIDCDLSFWVLFDFLGT